MELSLTDDDARTLRDLLNDHLHDLRLEVARTEAKDFRHVLLGRQELVECLLTQLELATEVRYAATARAQIALNASSTCSSEIAALL
jgi:hypothetical protein